MVPALRHDAGEKKRVLKTIKANLLGFFREAGADFGIPYDRVVHAKQLDRRVDLLIARLR